LVFPPQITITASPEKALSNAVAVMLVVPSQTMRQNLLSVKSCIKDSMLVINASKGLEYGSNKRMSQVIAEELPSACHRNICVLSGPNLHKEILAGLPASAVVAAEDVAVAKKAQKLLTSPNFAVYTNNDIIGVELGGALKNIIALGAGMVDGLGYGDNAKAAFITRGLTEMAAFSMALGANPLTLSGLSGLGDVIATCASSLSRNHYVGVELTKGRKLSEITSTMAGIAEGVATTAAVNDMAKKLNIEMPIAEKMYQVMYNDAEVKQVIGDLLGGKGRHELSGRRWDFKRFFRRPKKINGSSV
jgi:glycerol-3-phosphate dehydrogenase (NAD(P)+)